MWLSQTAAKHTTVAIGSPLGPVLAGINNVNINNENQDDANLNRLSDKIVCILKLPYQGINQTL